MILSRSKHMVSSKVKKMGSLYYSGASNTFYAYLSKSNVSQDLPKADFVCYAAFNASIDAGKIISRNHKYYVPIQLDEPDFKENIIYKKVFLSVANASGDLYHYDQIAASLTDQWDVAPASQDWKIKKTSVHVNFEKVSLRADNQNIGQIERGDFMVLMPWSVNASFTPVAECRFTDRQGRAWKIEDVDDKSYVNQAYLLRVSQDDR